MTVGQGDAGKTSTLKAMASQPFDAHEASTPGTATATLETCTLLGDVGEGGGAGEGFGVALRAQDEARAARNPFLVSLCAARTLSTIGQSRVTLSLR